MTGIWEHLVPQPKPYIGSFCYRYSINNLSLPDPGVPGVRSMGSGVSIYVTPRPFWNFAYVTLADDDNNSILTDDANRAIWSWWSSLRWWWSGKLVWRCSGSARWCMQELQGMMELWSCWRQYRLLDRWWLSCHWDGRVGRQGGVQGGKGGHQGVDKR